MRVHHLNCGSMRMPGADLVCHVLLVETGDGLVLVDSGFGMTDIRDPRRRIGLYRHVIRPALDPDETAVRQVRRLGYEPTDVRHIVLTHLDFDHVGGTADFPWAKVHVTLDEWGAATGPRTLMERTRYRPAGWAHRPQVVTHRPTGEPWRGFKAAQPLDEVDPRIVLIPMPGHTRGHAAVAVDAADRWILHVGDTFYDRSAITGARKPLVLSVQERAVAHDWARVRANQAHLAELYRGSGDELLIVSAHDPALLKQAQAA